jgi:hypothetical protein
LFKLCDVGASSCSITLPDWECRCTGDVCPDILVSDVYWVTGAEKMGGLSWHLHTLSQKTRQISEKIREEVPWRENFPVIRGNGDYFPSITGKFSPQESSSSLPTKIYWIIGTVYQANWWKHFHTYIYIYIHTYIYIR